jgi:hypothetical protein
MDVEVDRALVSVALSLPLFFVDKGDEACSTLKLEGGSINSSSSGIYDLARLGVDVRLFSMFLPGVPLGDGIRLGDGDEGPAPGVAE